MKTCTIGFADEDFDERPLARIVSGAFQTDHVERLVTPQDVHGLMEKLAASYDEPFGDASALPTSIVSGIARERVTVVLTGDGGDEVLSGYTIHQGEQFSRHFARVPGFVRTRVIPWGLSAAGSVAVGGVRHGLKRAGRVVRSANMTFFDRLEAKQTGFTRQERSELLGDRRGIRPARDYIENAVRRVQSDDSFQRLNYWLTTVALPDDMLCKVDRATMAHSLEARVPFLDHRLVELMAATSMSVKLRGYERKHVLRESVGRSLPPELLTARKRGFSVPLRHWLSNGADHAVRDRALAAGASGLLSSRALDRIVRNHTGDRGETGNAVWALAMLSFALD